MSTNTSPNTNNTKDFPCKNPPVPVHHHHHHPHHHHILVSSHHHFQHHLNHHHHQHVLHHHHHHPIVSSEAPFLSYPHHLHQQHLHHHHQFKQGLPPTTSPTSEGPPASFHLISSNTVNTPPQKVLSTKLPVGTAHHHHQSTTPPFNSFSHHHHHHHHHHSNYHQQYSQQQQSQPQKSHQHQYPAPSLIKRQLQMQNQRRYTLLFENLKDRLDKSSSRDDDKTPRPNNHFTPWPCTVSYERVKNEVFKGFNNNNDEETTTPLIFNSKYQPSGGTYRVFVGCANKYCTFEQFSFILMYFAGVELLDLEIVGQRVRSNSVQKKLADACFLTVAQEAVPHVIRNLHKVGILDREGLVHATPLFGRNLQKYKESDLLYEQFIIHNYCSAMNNARNEQKHFQCPHSLANAIVFKCPRDVLTFTPAGHPQGTPQENHLDKVMFENEHSLTCPCEDCHDFYFGANSKHAIDECGCPACGFERRAERVQKLFAKYEAEVKQQDLVAFSKKIRTHLTDHPLSQNIDGEQKMLREANSKAQQFFAELEQNHQEKEQRQEAKSESKENEKEDLLPSGYGQYSPGVGLFQRLPLSADSLNDDPDEFIGYLKRQLLAYSPRLHNLLREDYYNWEKYSISNENLLRLVKEYQKGELNTKNKKNLVNNTICRYNADSYHQRLVRFFKFNVPQNTKYHDYNFIVEVLNLFKGREEMLFPLFKECGFEEPPSSDERGNNNGQFTVTTTSAQPSSEKKTDFTAGEARPPRLLTFMQSSPTTAVVLIKEKKNDDDDDIKEEMDPDEYRKLADQANEILEEGDQQKIEIVDNKQVVSMKEEDDIKKVNETNADDEAVNEEDLTEQKPQSTANQRVKDDDDSDDAEFTDEEEF